jgi:hypothetical protein
VEKDGKEGKVKDLFCCSEKLKKKKREKRKKVTITHPLRLTSQPASRTLNKQRLYLTDEEGQTQFDTDDSLSVLRQQQALSMFRCVTPITSECANSIHDGGMCLCCYAVWEAVLGT